MKWSIYIVGRGGGVGKGGITNFTYTFKVQVWEGGKEHASRHMPHSSKGLFYIKKNNLSSLGGWCGRIISCLKKMLPLEWCIHLHETSSLGHLESGLMVMTEVLQFWWEGWHMRTAWLGTGWDPCSDFVGLRKSISLWEEQTWAVKKGYQCSNWFTLRLFCGEHP